MGDAGALMLGLIMAASTMSVVGQTDQDFSGRTFFFFAPVVIPFLILGIPILDTAFAIIRRAGRRTNPAMADKNHLHHRLMRLGHGQTRSVLILWTWTALLSGLVLYPSYFKGGLSIVPIGMAALGIALYTGFGVRGRTEAAAALSNGAVGRRPDRGRRGGDRSNGSVPPGSVVPGPGDAQPASGRGRRGRR
jgi:UDP-GlcNAc:undecaprenyl-phosphate GlcNAc-1-phosphate transferase